MSLVQVRNVPEEARRVLKARAAARGESLNSYLLGLIEREVSKPSVDEVLARAAQRAGRVALSAVEVLDTERAPTRASNPRRR